MGDVATTQYDEFAPFNEFHEGAVNWFVSYRLVAARNLVYAIAVGFGQKSKSEARAIAIASCEGVRDAMSDHEAFEVVAAALPLSLYRPFVSSPTVKQAAALYAAMGPPPPPLPLACALCDGAIDVDLPRACLCCSKCCMACAHATCVGESQRYVCTPCLVWGGDDGAEGAACPACPACGKPDCPAFVGQT